jgi:hypothetical protein
LSGKYQAYEPRYVLLNKKPEIRSMRAKGIFYAEQNFEKKFLKNQNSKQDL